MILLQSKNYNLSSRKILRNSALSQANNARQFAAAGRSQVCAPVLVVMLVIYLNAEGEYSEVYSVFGRALKSIDHIRPRLVLAIALVEDECEGKEFKPLGLCNFNEVNAIVVSGVISKVAFIVLTDDQVGSLPINYSYYRLNALRDGLGDAKLWHPKVGFKNFTDAKELTRQAAALISHNIDQEHNVSLS